MGRLNKRIAAAKRLKAEKQQTVSKSAVLQTLAKKDKAEDDLVQMTSKVPLLLEKPTKKSINQMKTASKITKKDKMKIRKDHLQNKLQVMKQLKQEQKESLKRKKKAIIGTVVRIRISKPNGC